MSVGKKRKVRWAPIGADVDRPRFSGVKPSKKVDHGRQFTVGTAGRVPASEPTHPADQHLPLGVVRVLQSNQLGGNDKEYLLRLGPNGEITGAWRVAWDGRYRDVNQSELDELMETRPQDIVREKLEAVEQWPDEIAVEDVPEVTENAPARCNPNNDTMPDAPLRMRERLRDWIENEIAKKTGRVVRDARGTHMMVRKKIVWEEIGKKDMPWNTFRNYTQSNHPRSIVNDIHPPVVWSKRGGRKPG